ncbi:hypothetical protein X474_17340 [Dethiosulfatarculus sandiegensis]|uniref:Uncharacterized protein n=1 Tax=Dethiosulfatarculus sandiegensis TaxID=1429043 RepID=A0A0D2J3U4_9BACT|nr:hypothetical protein X474_17340 [Dethiosulfatarculus sandiegensis]
MYFLLLEEIKRCFFSFVVFSDSFFRNDKFLKMRRGIFEKMFGVAVGLIFKKAVFHGLGGRFKLN